MEPRADDWDLVIKVKYGDTLKRFNAYVFGPAMDHNMNRLRSKIINLFKFSPDVDLVLTYTDGDGDVVTLEDDDELHDAVIVQRLNPLRINVQLKSNNTIGESYLRSQTESSTPASLQHIESKLNQISSTVEEALKSVPEPLSSAFSKLSHDVVLKAASSAPAFADFVDYFSKLGISNRSQTTIGPNGESLGTSSGITTQSGGPGISAEPKALNSSAPLSIVAPSASSVNPVPEHSKKQREIDNSSLVKDHSSVNYNMDIPDTSGILDASHYPLIDDLLASMWIPNDNMNQEKESGDDYHKGKSVLSSSPVSGPPIQTAEQFSRNFGTSKPPLSATSTFGMPDVMGGGYGEHLPVSGGPSSSISGLYSTSPGTATKPTPDIPLARPPFYPIGHPYRRADGFQENMLRTFHRGVRCDGCGMHPIVGPRFKSNVNEDYDLCSVCFAEMGNEAEYTRIDRTHPLSRRIFKDFHNTHSRYRHPSSHAFPACRFRPPRAKLESRFIQDVTVLDGTVMPPSTPFTKIWRMRNNGTTWWPYGTQLVWVGGDNFGNRRSVQLETPPDGCPVDMEIDIAVDFTSPSSPGRYVSYWRLAAPSGQKFGQRVWVLIQVDNSRPNSTSGRVPADINLNLPPENSGRNGVRIIDVNAEPLDGACPEPIHDIFSELMPPSPLIDETPGVNVEPATAARISQPLSEMITPAADPIANFPASSSTASPAASSALSSQNVEQTLLKELEEMGFTQIDLNKKILRQNEYDLAQAVDDLCGSVFVEWDPLLAELEEMGFHDREMNKKLLVKNDGSIKRVVLDLIAGEKAE